MQGLLGGESWRQSFGYDRYGNQWAAQHLGTNMPYSGLRPTQQSNYNASTNRRVEVTNQLAYDAAGELTRHGAWNLVYDAEGRIRQSTNTGTSQTTDYAYDGAGHRVKKTVGSASTWYVYDAFGQLAAEYTSSGPSGTAATHYLTTDHLGSTRLVTDGSGAVVSRHDYLPFGEEAPSNLGGRSTSHGYLANASLTQRFTGKERDTETGLDYFGARYMSAAMGRFTGADPIWVKADRLVDPQRLNLYIYSRNSPLRFTDPTGMDITIGKCSIGSADDCFNRMLQGIQKNDRSHVRMVRGDGKNGFKKGQFGVLVDKDHRSNSKNFQVLQSLANDRSAVAEISVVGPKEELAGNAGSIDASGKVTLKTFKETYGMNLTLEQGWFGQTFYQNWGGPPVDGATYSTRGLTEVYVGSDQTVNSMIETMHHELRHVLLGDFGRTVSRGQHGAPGVDQSTTEAESEARRNLRQR